MKFIKKVNKIAGNSIGIVIDRKYNKENLEAGDYIEVAIKRMIKKSK